MARFAKVTGWFVAMVAGVVAMALSAQQPRQDAAPARQGAAQQQGQAAMQDARQPVQGSNLMESDVRAIQRALNEAGHNAGPVDGIWGERTQTALRSFQQSKGIAPSGQLDQNTILALGFAADELRPTDAAKTASLSQADVRQVQEALNRGGYRAGPVDGIWGSRTQDALRNFQQARGLEPTGMLNEDTVLALGFSVSEFAAGEFQETDQPSSKGTMPMR